MKINVQWAKTWRDKVVAAWKRGTAKLGVRAVAESVPQVVLSSLAETPGTRSVDQINITNIQATGLKTAIDRYTFSLEFTWTDNAGVRKHYGPATHTWPNDLADVPQRIVKQWAADLVTQAVRWRLGIEAVPQE